MNDLSSDIGLLKREFRDARSVLSRLDSQVRRLVDGRPAFERCLAAPSGAWSPGVTRRHQGEAPGATYFKNAAPNITA